MYGLKMICQKVQLQSWQNTYIRRLYCFELRFTKLGEPGHHKRLPIVHFRQLILSFGL